MASSPNEKTRFMVSQYEDSISNQPLEESPRSPASPSSWRRINLRSMVQSLSGQTSVVQGSYWGDDSNVNSVAKRGLLFAKRHKKRLVYKSGECNISYMNIKKKKRMYLMDFFTTTIDLKWRYIILIFAFAFVGGWVLFAFIWWVILITHGDNNHYGEDDWNMCVDNVYDFQTALLFSIETQHTIGYGSRCMTPHCPIAVFFLMAQSCFGVMVQAMMAGLVFAKLSRPIKRGQTIMFSKNAVICQRDGQRYLLFRVADTRKSRLVASIIRAAVVKRRVTAEGEVLPFHQHHITVEPENEDDYLFLVWPLTIMHKIDENSIFYDLTAEQLLKEQFELIVFLEGTVEPTGMSTQVRTSYLPSEILWGHQLASLMTYKKENGEYLIDYTRFHNTIPTRMSECSAREHEEKQDNSADVGRNIGQTEKDHGQSYSGDEISGVEDSTDETSSGIKMTFLGDDLKVKDMDTNSNVLNNGSVPVQISNS